MMQPPQAEEQEVRREGQKNDWVKLKIDFSALKILNY
jgi:hypothetical protein